MQHAAGTPPFGIAAAAALLAGISACLWLPWLSPWWCSALWLLCGLAALGWGWTRSRPVALVAGWLLLGFGLAGLHASWALARQLPP